MNVGDIMTIPVRTLASGDTLATAATMMRAYDVGCLPVVGESGMLVGILTGRDIALSTYRLGDGSLGRRVIDAMNRQVWTCRAEDDVDAAAVMMREHRVRRLPVVDAGGTPIGMVSLGDLARASRQAWMNSSTRED